MPRLTQRTFIAAAIAVPAVIAAMGLTAIQVYRGFNPAAPLFGGEPASLAEAITGGYGVEYAYRFVHTGQSPNEPIVVDAPQYTGGRSIRVSPLMLAIAARDDNVVQMLVTFGARLDLPQNRLAACLAQEVNDTFIVSFLARNSDAKAAPVTCRAPATDAPTPLLRWTEGSITNGQSALRATAP